MRQGLRFRPPGVEYTPEMRWALLRAFGPIERGFSRAIEPEVAIGVAGSLDLSPRIAARAPLSTLQAELGEGGARSLLITKAATAMISAELLKCARVVAEAAAALSVPVAFLKGVALRLVGVVEEGSRWLSDVDVLAPAGSARGLTDALIGRGFRVEDVPAEEHQLRPLLRGGAEMVEVHHALNGVRLASRRRYAGFEELHEGFLLAPTLGLPGACFVPTRELLVAHTLVHGLAQHGLAPQGYPLMRTMADLVDLGLAGPEGASALGAARAWIAGDVSLEETEAARALCIGLAGGDERLFERGAADRPEAVLLRHVVAGLVDESYRSALRVSASWDVPTGRSRVRSLATMAFHTMFLTRGQVDIIYGRPRTGLGYLGRRLARPFDLASRAIRYSASAIRLRRRV